MLEFILLFIFFYFIINGFSKRKARKPRTLDAELRALINEHNTNTGIALDIKRYLLDIINDNRRTLKSSATTESTKPKAL